MDLFIGSALVFDIVRDDGRVPEFAHRVHIVPLRPELATPQLLFHLGVFAEDHLRGDTLRELGEARGRILGDGLDEEMDVVFVSAHFVVSDFVPLLDTEAGFFERFHDFGSEDVPAILCWANEVVQEEVLVVALEDVLIHPLILTPEDPEAELRGNIDYMWTLPRQRVAAVRIFRRFKPLQTSITMNDYCS